MSSYTTLADISERYQLLFLFLTTVVILLIAFLSLLYREQFVIVIYNKVLFINTKIAKLLAYIIHTF